MDVNWYAVEVMTHHRLAELRISMAASRRLPAPARRERAAWGRALARLGQRMLDGLGAARVVAVRWLGLDTASRLRLSTR